MPGSASDRPPFASPVRRVAFSGLMVAAMASASYQATGLGLIAAFLIDDLGIDRAQIGLLITATIAGAGLTSPLAGSVTDVLGGRRSLFVMLVASAAGFVGLAAAPVYWLMFVPILASALAQAAANPTTNKLILSHAPPRSMGLIIGIKQAGVQAAVFFGGVTVPSIALAVGWRWALAVVAVLPVVSLLVARWLLPPDGRMQRRHRRDADRLHPSIRLVALHGMLIGFGGAYVFLVPLFVQESLGGSERLGGLTMAMIGLFAIAGRVAWGRVAGRPDRCLWSLTAVAVVAMAAAALFFSSMGLGVWMTWPAAVLSGIGASSWSSVGMAAAATIGGAERAGRASGVVMLGYFAGLGAAPTVYGWTVDVTGSYAATWVISLVASVTAVALAEWWRRRTSGADR